MDGEKRGIYQRQNGNVKSDDKYVENSRDGLVYNNNHCFEINYIK